MRYRVFCVVCMLHLLLKLRSDAVNFGGVADDGDLALRGVEQCGQPSGRRRVRHLWRHRYYRLHQFPVPNNLMLHFFS